MISFKVLIYRALSFCLWYSTERREFLTLCTTFTRFELLDLLMKLQIVGYFVKYQNFHVLFGNDDH